MKPLSIAQISLLIITVVLLVAYLTLEKYRYPDRSVPRLRRVAFFIALICIWGFLIYDYLTT